MRIREAPAITDVAPAMRLTRDLIASGRLGPIRHVKAVTTSKWQGHRPGGFRALTSRSLVADALSVLLDTRQAADNGSATVLTGCDTASLSDVWIAGSAAEGNVITAEVSFEPAGPDTAPHLEIFGDKGVVLMDLAAMYEIAFLDFTAELKDQGFRRLLARDVFGPAS